MDQITFNFQGAENRRDDKKDTNPNQPSHDQIYLGGLLGAEWEQPLTPAAMVKLNKAHGRAKVESAMRSLRGFPPAEAVRSLYAYIAEIARQDGAA